MNSIVDFPIVRRQNERELVDIVEEAFLVAGARATYREVQARWEGFRSDKRRDGRIDLVVIPPSEWCVRTGLWCLAIEAKDTPGTGDTLIGQMQAESAMLATEVFVNLRTKNGDPTPTTGKGPKVDLTPGRRLPRVSWALLTTRTWWLANPREDEHPLNDRGAIVIERQMRIRFGSILARDYHMRPAFVAHRDGRPEERLACFEEPRK